MVHTKFQGHWLKVICGSLPNTDHFVPDMLFFYSVTILAIFCNPQPQEAPYKI